MSRTIAVVNQKGGVGKTTTAVNLAAGLALAEKPTLLIDMDPQANATMSMGLRPEELEKTVYDALLEPGSLPSIITRTAIAHLALLPANADLIAAEVKLVSDVGRVFRLRKALEVVRGEFSHIIIDCPPSLGLLTVNAICASNSVIIPLQCEYYSLEGLSRTLDAIRVFRETLGLDIELAGLLLTMLDSRTKLSCEVAAEVRKHFVGKVFTTVIPRNIRVAEAPGHGKPVILYDVGSRGSQAFLGLTEEFLRSEGKEETWSRLGGDSRRVGQRDGAAIGR
ncbi:MAG: ParA family protein [Candidatus Coatesbacteria bacterium]|nr:ParA family protein [Candidatus Coatesbacteria bacterium]